ncbi:MAG: molybdenum cofactor biosynthesis protein MoaE [Bacteroidota bacterium]
MVLLTSNPIDVQTVLKSVATPGSGGIDIFIGTTRDHSGGRAVTSLEYEAYEPMALREMERIERQARKKWPLEKVAIVHRLGSVPIGEASVVIAVSSAHRKQAFEACRFVIDALKKEVPIWKREHFADGTEEWSGQRNLTLNDKSIIGN